MTEAKNQRMTIVEKFYIENNWETLDVDTLSNHTKVQKRSIKRFVDKLKQKKDKSQMEHKIESPQSTKPMAPAEDMMARKGVAIMTKAAAELGDDIRKKVQKINSNCTVQIRSNNV